jgi:uncharacterized protein (DUF427 family)
MIEFMSSRMAEQVLRASSAMRHEPTPKRIRATLGGETVLDTTSAVIVWEPRRVVPTYAAPAGDLQGELIPAAPAAEQDALGVRLGERMVLDPSIPFGVHTLAGEALSLRRGSTTHEGVAFRPSDPDLDDLVILDFDAFDAWYEEDEPNVGHPRDPFHRIDILHSSRTVRVERDGAVLAESARPRLLFETMLPVRAYVPREDVRVPLEPSDKHTFCAYKGQASYWTPVVGGQRYENLAWSYDAPLREAAEISGLIAFFNEHADLVVDSERWERPLTPWS